MKVSHGIALAYAALGFAADSIYGAEQLPLGGKSKVDQILAVAFPNLPVPSEAVAMAHRLVDGPAEPETRKPKRQQPKRVHANYAEYPNHALRVFDPSELGMDPGVKQYSGYLDVIDDDKHFFFWMYESRNDPATDPVILWLNGGPGCSSSLGEFFELGPSFIDVDGKIVHNPHSWNSNATVIFLDQPVNVGYSYSSNRVGSSEVAAEDVYTFLELLFDAFPEYNNGQEFHVSGESYGGHYLPAIGKAILSHEERTFDLSSILLGNPITDLRFQAEAKVAMACGEGGYPSLYTSEQCTDLYRKLPRCEQLVQACYDSDGTDVVCMGANLYCSQLAEPYFAFNRSTYDISLKCSEEKPCYPEQDAIDKFLNLEYVKKAVGADVDSFVGCNHDVGTDFQQTGDYAKDFAHDLVYILKSGVPILQYSGKLDWTCNILGSRRFLGKLQWDGAFDFNSAYLKPWKVDGKTVGWSRSSSDLLTYLEIEDAGHMVPHDKPKLAKIMLDHWLAGNRRF